MTLKKSFLPANPGFFIVQHYQEDNKTVDAGLLPIVGWSCGSDGLVEPVSIFSTDGQTKYPIQTPDGTVIDIFENTYDDVATWVLSKNKDA